MSGPRVLVTGGRDYTGNPMHVSAIFRILAPSVVVHGACPTGADALADYVAKTSGIPREPHPADWSEGRRAGPLRNREMADAGADLCLAFPGGRGTADMVGRALLKGIPVIQCDQDDTMDLVRAFRRAYTADVRDRTIREMGDTTGSPVACPECGAKLRLSNARKPSMDAGPSETSDA